MKNGLKSKIFLVGFMGSGKSTFGRQLAVELGYEFVDLDHVFEKKYKISINGFFEKYDESLFRKLEYEVLIESFQLEKTVISTGGGTACFFDAMDQMNSQGLTIYLKMTIEQLFDRLKTAKRKRPLVQGKEDDELMKTIDKLLLTRQPFYEQAIIEVEAIDIDLQSVKNKLDSI